LLQRHVPACVTSVVGVGRQRAVEQRRICREPGLSSLKDRTPTPPSATFPFPHRAGAPYFRDHRIAAAPRAGFLAAAATDGHVVEGEGVGRGDPERHPLRRQLGRGRITEQAPDLGGHGVEAGRQRQESAVEPNRHRLHEGRPAGKSSVSAGMVTRRAVVHAAA